MEPLNAQLLAVFARRAEILPYEQSDAAEQEYLRWVVEGTPTDGLRPEDAAVLMARPLTVALAAKRERVSERTVYRWLATGELAATRAGSKWQIMAADLDRRRVESSKPRPKPEPTKRRVPRRKATATSNGRAWPT